MLKMRFICCGLVVLATLVAAQNASGLVAGDVGAQPSLSDSTSWLEENLPALSSGDDGLEVASHKIIYRINHCVIHVVDRFESAKSDSQGEAEKTTFYTIEASAFPGKRLTNLASSQRVDPAMLRNANISTEARLSVELQNLDLGSVRVEAHGLDWHQVERSADLLDVFGNDLRISTPDAALARRSAKFLKRAAALCGAKALNL